MTEEKQTFEGAYHVVSMLTSRDLEAKTSERLNKLFEEVGEFARAVNKLTGRKRTSQSREEIYEEILEEAADTIQNVLCVLSPFCNDPQKLLNVLRKKNDKWRTILDREDEDRRLGKLTYDQTVAILYRIGFESLVTPEAALMYFEQHHSGLYNKQDVVDIACGIHTRQLAKAIQ